MLGGTITAKMYWRDAPKTDGFTLPPGYDGKVMHAALEVGEARIKTQPGNFELAGEGLCIGRDSGAAVTADYAGQRPYRFTGGTIQRVAVDVSGQPYLDLEREAAAMLARE